MSDLLEFLNNEAREYAKARGKRKYKGLLCYVPGHSRDGERSLRYTRSGECVICADGVSRQQVKVRVQTLAPTPDVSRSTREFKMWAAARKRAAERGLNFTLKVSDIVIPEVCPVLGIPMDSPSLDRFDNREGYTTENVRVISSRANRLKSDASPIEILLIARYMVGQWFFRLLM